MYRRWTSMMDRCYRERSAVFKHYGGRGITVCDAWHDFETFAKDIEALGPCPEGYSMDRIENDEGYRPGNIRWADQMTQLRNRRPNSTPKPRKDTKTFVMDGAKALNVKEAAKALGCREDTLKKRLARHRSNNPLLTHIDLKALR